MEKFENFIKALTELGTEFKQVSEKEVVIPIGAFYHKSPDSNYFGLNSKNLDIQYCHTDCACLHVSVAGDKDNLSDDWTLILNEKYD